MHIGKSPWILNNGYNIMVLLMNEQVNHSMFGYASTCYKAVNTKNKSHCVLRRLHGKLNNVIRTFIGTMLSGYKLSSVKAVQEVHRWRKVSHANVVALHEMFTTKVFGDNCKLRTSHVCPLYVRVH